MRTLQGKTRKSFTAKEQGDVVRKRDEYLRKIGCASWPQRAGS